MSYNRDPRAKGRSQTQEPQAGPSREMNTGKKAASQPSLPRSSSLTSNKKVLGTRNGPPISVSSIPVSKTSRNSASSSNIPRGRRRSQSVELPSNEPTPVSAIPSSSIGKRRSKSSERITKSVRGSRRDHTTLKFNQITIPSARDTDVLEEMAQFIFEFLVRHNCAARPGTWRVLANPARMSVHMFVEVTKFVATLFVGDGFFVKGNEVQDFLKVKELLNYPGQLTKSHLITPTAQHAWPGHLTFIAWLCFRAQQAFESETDQDSMVSELANDETVFHRVALESWIFLHPYHIHGALTEDVIEAAACNLREEAKKIYSPEGNETTEELKEKKENLAKNLEGLKNETGPAKDAEDHLAELETRRAIIKKEIENAEALKMKYSNLTLLRFQKEDADMGIKNKLKVIKGLKQHVASQPLSKDAAAEISKEIEDVKEKVHSLVSLNKRLKVECEKEAQMLENLKSQFHTTCSQFFRVARYNTAVRSLNLDDLIITPNPFSPEEMPGWLKVASDTLKRAKETVSHMMTDAESASKQKKKEKIKTSVEVENLRKEVQEYKTKLEAQQDELSFVYNEFKCQNKAEKKKLEDLRVEIGKAEEELDKLKTMIDIWKKSLEEWSQRQEEFKQAEIGKRNEVSQALAQLKLDDAELKEYVLNKTDYVLQRQQQYYQENYGIDIFANPSANPSGAE